MTDIELKTISSDIKTYIERHFLDKEKQFIEENDSIVKVFNPEDMEIPQIKKRVLNQSKFLSKENKLYSKGKNYFVKRFIDELRESNPSMASGLLHSLINEERKRIAREEFEIQKKMLSNSPEHNQDEYNTKIAEIRLRAKKASDCLNLLSKENGHTVKAIVHMLKGYNATLEVQPAAEFNSRDELIYEILREGTHADELIHFINESKRLYNNITIDCKNIELDYNNIIFDNKNVEIKYPNNGLNPELFKGLIPEEQLKKDTWTFTYSETIEILNKLINEVANAHIDIASDYKQYNATKYRDIVVGETQNITDRIERTEKLLRIYNFDEIHNTDEYKAYIKDRARIKKINSKIVKSKTDKEEIEKFNKLISKLRFIIKAEIIKFYKDFLPKIGLEITECSDNEFFNGTIILDNYILTKLIVYMEQIKAVIRSLDRQIKNIDSTIQTGSQKLADYLGYIELTGNENWIINQLDILSIYERVFIKKLYDSQDEEITNMFSTIKIRQGNEFSQK